MDAVPQALNIRHVHCVAFERTHIRLGRIELWLRRGKNSTARLLWAAKWCIRKFRAAFELLIGAVRVTRSTAA